MPQSDNTAADGFTVAKCCRCGSCFFPRRLICRRCGSDIWADERLHDAVVEESTTVAHVAGGGQGAPRILATVCAVGGLRLIVGLELPLREGTCVRLSERNGAPIGRAVDRG
jgi:uncharacterized OB-fold protein